MEIQAAKRAWQRAVKKYGRKTMVLGLVTMPFWFPLWVALMGVSLALQMLGALGKIIENKIN